MERPPAEWLASGGAYWVIFGQTIVSAIAFTSLALWIGKKLGAEGDGCLLAIANLVLALLGSAVGFLLLPYPRFVLGSLIGTIVLPTISTLVFTQLIRRR